MIESMMYFGAGFLFATLIGVTVIPLVHGRAVRLTIRRLEDSIPQSMAEIQADKDALRAEFAMSTRRLEMSVEQLQNKSANQLAELGRKGDAINRLKVERETQKVEVLALKTEVNSLKEGLTAAPEEAEAAEDLRHERNVVTLVPSTAEPVPMPAAFLQGPPLDGQPHEDDLISIPGELPKAEEARSGNTARDPYAGRDSYEQRIGMALERSDFLLRGAEPSIHVSRRTPGYQSMGDKPPIGRRISRDLTRFSVAAL